MSEASDMHTMTVRLAAEQHAELKAVAEVEGVPVSDIIREAIAATLDKRRRNKAFQKRLRRHLEENRRTLERLAARSGEPQSTTDMDK